MTKIALYACLKGQGCDLDLSGRLIKWINQSSRKYKYVKTCEQNKLRSVHKMTTTTNTE